MGLYDGVGQVSPSPFGCSFHIIASGEYAREPSAESLYFPNDYANVAEHAISTEQIIQFEVRLLVFLMALYQRFKQFYTEYGLLQVQRFYLEVIVTQALRQAAIESSRKSMARDDRLFNIIWPNNPPVGFQIFMLPQKAKSWSMDHFQSYLSNGLRFFIYERIGPAIFNSKAADFIGRANL